LANLINNMEVNTDATVLYDIDVSSVGSSLNSKKNAELIAAAFSCDNNSAEGNDEIEDDAISLVSSESVSKDQDNLTTASTKIAALKTTAAAANINGYSSFSNKEDLITIATSGEDDENQIFVSS